MTTPTVPQAESWNPEVLCGQGVRWRSVAESVDAEVGRLARAADATRDHWGGVAADTARVRATQIGAVGMRTASALHEAADAANSAAAQIACARDAVLAAVAAARAEAFDVGDDGAVAPSPGLFVSAASTTNAMITLAAVEHRARQHRAVIRTALGELGAADGRATSTIDTAFARLPRPGDPGSGWFGTRSVPVPPPDRASPTENRRWWDGLTPAQQQEMIATSPAAVGNRDGLPSEARHRANVHRLATEHAALETARQELVRRAAGLNSVDARFARVALADVARRLADLDAVRTTIGDDPGRKLLLLDARSGEQLHAAVAIGDPDTADHIAVSTPGLNATVRGSLGSMVDEATALRQEVQVQLAAAAGREHETVATIAWVGYDAPQMSGSVVDGIEGGLAVAQADRARTGARDLARFYDGLGVAHTGSDPHVTAVGHSYGSVTTGLALREPGYHPVDDMVVYGSPGLVGVESPSDLGLGPGHAYEMTAGGDVIAYLNRFGPGPYGGGPHTTDGFTHLATDAVTTPDGVARDGASGHSEYPRPGDNGRLRTSGYNLAAIVADLPTNAVVIGAATGGRLPRGAGDAR
ncbi:alpha/beta hydrolase [Rhodococcus sp. ACT016]|uniref:alpha/beta hydrolase n=1 Tax=Rhodococcus sp. ACT016 TaxID=3134808 RepID=UPI003D2A959B